MEFGAAYCTQNQMHAAFIKNFMNQAVPSLESKPEWLKRFGSPRHGMSAFSSAGCFILVDPSIVAKRLHISPYINRVLEYFQNKDKMGKFYPPCLPRKT